MYGTLRIAWAKGFGKEVIEKGTEKGVDLIFGGMKNGIVDMTKDAFCEDGDRQWNTTSNGEVTVHRTRQKETRQERREARQNEKASRRAFEH